jgi:hypothetical protein
VRVWVVGIPKECGARSHGIVGGWAWIGGWMGDVAGFEGEDGIAVEGSDDELAAHMVMPFWRLALRWDRR